MLAKMVEKFATDVIDTGGAPWLANISAKKFETVLMEYSGAGGKLITEKNQKRKILWHYPFKSTRIWNPETFVFLVLCVQWGGGGGGGGQSKF
jgi:hypothetical protein